MVIFHCYFSSPEGIPCGSDWISTMTSKVDLWSPWPWCPTQTTSGSSCTHGSDSDSTVEKWPSESSSTCCSCCSRCTCSSLCLHGIPKEWWDQSGWRSTSDLQRRAGSTAFHCPTGQLVWNIFSTASTCKGSFTGWQQGSSLHPRDWRSGLGLLGSCSLQWDPSFEAQASSKGATATAPIVEASEEYRTRNLRRVQFSLTMFSRCSSIWKLRLGRRLQSRCGSLGVAAVQMNVQKNGDAWHHAWHHAWWCMVMYLGYAFCYAFCHLLLPWTPLQSQGFMRCQASTLHSEERFKGPREFGFQAPRGFFSDNAICCISFVQDFLLQEEIERERERWNLKALDPSEPVGLSNGFPMAFHWVPPSKISQTRAMAHQRSGQREREEREKERKRREEEPMPQLLPWCYHGATFA